VGGLGRTPRVEVGVLRGLAGLQIFLWKPRLRLVFGQLRRRLVYQGTGTVKSFAGAQVGGLEFVWPPEKLRHFLVRHLQLQLLLLF